MGENKKPKLQWCSKTGQRKKETTKVSQGQLLSAVPLMDLKLKLKERIVCVADGRWLCHITYSPPASSLFILVGTDVVSPGVPLLTEGAAVTQSWWLRGLLELTEDRHSLFLHGFLPSMLLFALWSNPSPLGYHRLFVQVFIIVFGTLHCIIFLPVLPLPLNLHFLEEGTLSCLWNIPRA